jgi:uncharacterized protein (DUF952 family)
VAGAANRFFRDVPDLVLLQIDPMRLESRLVYEALTPGEKFPHIYGPLQVDAVVGVTSFEPGPDGLF